MTKRQRDFYVNNVIFNNLACCWGSLLIQFILDFTLKYMCLQWGHHVLVEGQCCC